MKSPAAYYLILLYVTVILKPLLPIINDVWSHTFNGIEHISLVHAKNGNHHLQKEVADSETDRDKKNNQNILKSQDQVPFHILVAESKNDFTSDLSSKEFLVLKFPKLPTVFITQLGPPPKI